MTMQRWDPFNEMYSLRHAMDRLLEDAVIWPGRQLGSGAGQTGSIPVDVLEQGDHLLVRASLPGVRPEDVSLQVQGNTLTIEGELHEETEQPQSQPGQGNGQQARQADQAGQPRYHYRERRYGRFFRQVTLPMPVDANKTEAHFEHGVLTVTLPKAQEARQRRIPITGGSQAQQLAAGRTR